MPEIKATWRNGQIHLAEPVDWPEGIELRVAPANDMVDGEPDEPPANDPEALAAWIAEVRAIPPFEWAQGEEEAFERYRAEVRRLNIEAVRRRMAAVPGAVT
jgi:hypothetical protein